MYCNYCKKQIDDFEQRCPYCKKIVFNPNNAGSSDELPPLDPERPGSNWNGYSTRSGNKSAASSVFPIFAAGVIIATIFALILCMFLLNKEKTSPVVSTVGTTQSAFANSSTSSSEATTTATQYNAGTTTATEYTSGTTATTQPDATTTETTESEETTEESSVPDSSAEIEISESASSSSGTIVSSGDNISIPDGNVSGSDENVTVADNNISGNDGNVTIAEDNISGNDENVTISQQEVSGGASYVTLDAGHVTLPDGSEGGIPVYNSIEESLPIAYLPYGAICQVYETNTDENQDWNHISYCGLEGWVPARYMSYVSDQALYAEITEENPVVNVYVSQPVTTLYSGPGEENDIILPEVDYGTEFAVTSFSNGWAETSYNDAPAYLNMQDVSCYNGQYYQINNSDDLVGLYSLTDESEALTTLPAGVVLQFDSYESGYGHTNYNGIDGWVRLSNVTPCSANGLIISEDSRNVETYDQENSTEAETQEHEDSEDMIEDQVIIQENK